MTDGKLIGTLCKMYKCKVAVVPVAYGEYYMDCEAGKGGKFRDHEDIDGPFTISGLEEVAASWLEKQTQKKRGKAHRKVTI